MSEFPERIAASIVRWILVVIIAIAMYKFLEPIG